MVDIRTLDQLQDALDAEMGWRIKEIGVFRFGSRTNSLERKPFIRAGIALLYAHWEGFVKSAAEAYLAYVESRGHSYSELKTCFSVFGLKGKLDTLVEAKKAAANVAALDFIIAEMHGVARFRLSSAINTESNLSSVVFKNIAQSINIDIQQYETKNNLIDISLVERRNKIAHGEFLEIGGKEFGELVTEVIGIMRQFKTDLENAASLEAYKRIAT